MRKEHIQRFFPDTYSIFRDAPLTHPFWRAVDSVDFDQAKSGSTLLTDIEQVFAWLISIDNHHVAQDYLTDVNTHEELMEELTKLYVAYLYRDHNPRMVTGEHGYDIEMEVADQLLAMGVVQFHNMEKPEAQFADAVEDEIAHLQSMQENGMKNTSSERGVTSEANTAAGFFEHLQHHAGKLKDHPKASHQVIAAISKHGELPAETALAQHIGEHIDSMKKRFPHIAGIVLVDPTPGTESAKFVPFHGDNTLLESLLHKR